MENSAVIQSPTPVDSEMIPQGVQRPRKKLFGNLALRKNGKNRAAKKAYYADSADWAATAVTAPMKKQDSFDEPKK